MSLGLFFNESGFKPDVSTKELIVRILCDEWPLSIRQIHERVKRTHGFECSYQAIFKQVKELMGKGIISCDGRCYKMSLEWLERVNFFIERLVKHYEKNPEGVIGSGEKAGERFFRRPRNPALNPYI